MIARRVWHKRPLVNGGRWLSTTLRFESPLSSSFHSLLPLPPGSASPIRYPIIAYNVNGRWFSSEAMADVAAGGNGNGIVDVPLAQTGEGIAECELLKWFVREWVADINAWRSITGYMVIIQFHGNPKSDLQYLGVLLRQNTNSLLIVLQMHVGFDQSRKTYMFIFPHHQFGIDNLSTLALSTNPVFHSRIKHLDTDFHFVCEKVQKGDLMVQYIPTKEQVADIFY